MLQHFNNPNREDEVDTNLWEFHCKFCKREMISTFLEYKSNSYCNECFDERVKQVSENNMFESDTFEFMGEIIPLDD